MTRDEKTQGQQEVQLQVQPAATDPSVPYAAPYRTAPGRMLDPSSDEGTGIFVRAMSEGRWVNADIVELDRGSLLAWLRSRGGNNRWAEDVVGILLGHGHLHPLEQPDVG